MHMMTHKYCPQSKVYSLMTKPTKYLQTITNSRSTNFIFTLIPEIWFEQQNLVGCRRMNDCRLLWSKLFDYCKDNVLLQPKSGLRMCLQCMCDEFDDLFASLPFILQEVRSSFENIAKYKCKMIMTMKMKIVV